jgi:hypothetical protein
MKTEKLITKIIYQIMALLVLFALSIKALQSFAQSNNFDVMCRAKAKELANQSYKNCMYENRTTELEKLKKDFQAKMKKLKEDYEKEVARIGGKVSKNKNSKQTAASSTSTSSMKVELKADPSANVNKVEEAPEVQISTPTLPEENAEPSSSI